MSAGERFAAVGGAPVGALPPSVDRVPAISPSGAIGQASTVPSARSPCGKRAVTRRDTEPSSVNTMM